MFASIWYAKKLGRRLVQSSRKAKLLKDEVSLTEGILYRCAGLGYRSKEIQFQSRFRKKKRSQALRTYQCFTCQMLFTLRVREWRYNRYYDTLIHLLINSLWHHRYVCILDAFPPCLRDHKHVWGDWSENEALPAWRAVAKLNFLLICWLNVCVWLCPSRLGAERVSETSAGVMWGNQTADSPRWWDGYIH